MRVLAFMLLATLACACAETDPYKRLPGGDVAVEATDAQAQQAFDTRWPVQFKAVQTVTIDFGPVTRTLVGYLIVQQPGRFRLQGMTEQGIKVFDIVGDDAGHQIAFAAPEFDQKILGNIARDIRRVFVSRVHTLVGSTPQAAATGSRATFSAGATELKTVLVGKEHHIDNYDFRRDGRSLYRVDHYEWKDFDADAEAAARPAPGSLMLPSVIVLRERGVQSDGAPYKLTVEVTELAVRKKEWPSRVFEVVDGDRDE